MTILALVLVLCAAVMHATWNLLAKHAGGGAAFLWLFGGLAAALYTPVVAAVLLIQRPHLGTLAPLFLVGTTLLHLAYFLLLQRGYGTGDLSVVYPLARGTGPLLSVIAAIVLFGERPGPVAFMGTLLIALGVVILTSGPRVWQGSGAAVLYGLLTGTTIASYTLWDKQAVSTVLIPPLLLVWFSQAGQTALLTPYAARHWQQIRRGWRAHWRAALGIAILMPLAYVLVLSALVFTPVSYVAPAREVSILIGTLMGTRLLAEGQGRRRFVAASAMLLGIVALVV